MYQGGGQQGMNPNYGYEGGPPPPMIQNPLHAVIQTFLLHAKKVCSGANEEYIRAQRVNSEMQSLFPTYVRRR
ncbi:hypothetical protein WR25_11641 [Diploscapter pachys]|uniref:Uncharacterized protein n=1 Tax=Diploscapter pachys TaxID=2018661 RepID=A0A2A2M3S9_9BILA|nr:hypothetical protein WR25_11641 [Diploscapter pachys]